MFGVVSAPTLTIAPIGVVLASSPVSAPKRQRAHALFAAIAAVHAAEALPLPRHTASKSAIWVVVQRPGVRVGAVPTSAIASPSL